MAKIHYYYCYYYYYYKSNSNGIHSKGRYQISISVIIMAALKNPVRSCGVGV